MTEIELKKYLQNTFPKENEKCEWKEYKSLKHCVSSHEGDDIISYVSAIANMKGGHLIIGIKDRTFNIIGVQDFSNYNTESIKLKIVNSCTNLNSEGFEVEEFITTDTFKTVWVFSYSSSSISPSCICT
ncbi:MAG: ATP-binding protein [Phycisphaerales bacterium]|nr:ATP-binding protein [Phycisphaerales bacterium]